MQAIGSGGAERVPLPVPSSAAKRYVAGTLPATGCYLVTYKAVSPLVAFDGTLRLDAATGPLLASGDLYGRDTISDFKAGTEVLGPGPVPAAAIPVFRLDHYRYYLSVTRIEGTADAFTLVFDACRFTPQGAVLLDGSHTRWPKESTLTARMARASAPAGFPMPERYFEGDVADETGLIAGRLSMGWVSSSLRRASVKVDRVPGAKFPGDAGAGATWTSIFAEAGWDFTVVPGDENVADIGGDLWTGAYAHKAMTEHTEGTDLDKEWRYYILAVRGIKSIITPGGERGYMFDKSNDDLDKRPRQGLLIASDWKAPDIPAWGRLRGQPTGGTVAYFRTAVHELGHALGLDHNESDNGIMCTTEKIAARSVTSGVVFPDNIQWGFASDDAHRLRHWPDHLVRPGGVDYSPGDHGPTGRIKSDKLRLEASPVAETVPLGAPVRIDLRLINTAPVFIAGPLRLTLMAGSVSGRVAGPSGTGGAFASLVVSENPHASDNIGPGASLDGSLTLLRGGQGALFPVPGACQIATEAHWFFQNVELFADAATSVTVTPAADPAHAAAAREILSTPETLLVLALGGDHIEAGIAAIGLALNSPVLRPHFAAIEARRLATRTDARPPDLAAAAALIVDTTVMSTAEVSGFAQIVNDMMDDPAAPALAAALRAWAAANPVRDEIKQLVDGLPV